MTDEISVHAAIDGMLDGLHRWFAQLRWYPGCQVTDVSGADDGYIICRISGGTNQQCSWKKLFSIAVGDYVDVLYDPASMRWEVFKPGGSVSWSTSLWNIDHDCIRMEYTNNATGTLSLGEVVVFDSTQDYSVTTTNSEGDIDVAGVVLIGAAAGATVQVAVLGQAAVYVDGNVTRGQFLKTSSSRGFATPTSTFDQGVFGVALTANTAGASGTVDAFLVGHNWMGTAGAGGAHNILSATHTDSAAAAAVLGDVMTVQAGPLWTRLPIGTQGFFFKADSGTTPSWVRISTQTCTVGPGTTCEANTLGAAVALVNAAGPPTAANPWVIRLYGGVYTETGNITIPSYCWVIGEGEGTQINMGTGGDITFSANSGMESCYTYGNPTSYLLGTTAAGVVWRNVRAHLTGTAGGDIAFRCGTGGDVEAWHCIASDASATGTETGFYNQATLFMYGCQADNMVRGVQSAAGTLTTLYCEFMDNLSQDVLISSGNWVHFQTRSLRTVETSATSVVSAHTHWPNGEYLDLNFTGTSWGTKAECNYVGLRFSDTDTPFPTTFVQAVSGSWAHSAGNGWAPSFTTNLEGPVILTPLMRAANWELDVDFEYTPGNVNQRFGLQIGYITNSNHVGAYGTVRDNNAAANELQYFLSTNDGDDTYTTQYTGVAIAGATGNYEIRFRCQNGCVGVYDDQDNAWHYYSGRQSAGISYTAAHAYLQFYRVDANVPTLRVRNLKLTYLL